MKTRPMGQPAMGLSAVVEANSEGVPYEPGDSPGCSSTTSYM